MWLDREVSFYQCQAENIGQPMTYRQILLTQFAVPHRWWHFDKDTKQLYKGVSNDLETIIKMRNMDRSAPDYKANKVLLKATLQSFTPAALLESKKKGSVIEKNRPGIMQLDFDYQDISQFDIEELKQAVFNQLPFIGFCGLSCSGEGFYALALIAEPERLEEYATHCFDVLLQNGIKADTSKGKKPENLRYVSYDANMLIRENPEPLLIKRFKPKPVKQTYENNYSLPTNCSALVTKELQIIKDVLEGGRWAAVQKVAFTLGGLGVADNLYLIKDCIKSNPAFTGQEVKYIKCAEDCFSEGIKRPL